MAMRHATRREKINRMRVQVEVLGASVGSVVAVGSRVVVVGSQKEPLTKNLTSARIILYAGPGMNCKPIAFRSVPGIDMQNVVRNRQDTVPKVASVLSSKCDSVRI